MISVFKIGVHLGMTSNASSVLSLLLREITGVHIAAGNLEKKLGQVGQAAIGLGRVFVGGAIIKGLISATEHAEKLNHELIKLQIGANLSDAQTTDVGVDAFRISRSVPGSHADEIVKQRRELFGVFGDMDEAKEMSELVSRGSLAVSNYVDKGTDLAQIAVRALENRGHITKDGKIDPKEFATEFNAMVRSIAASESLVDPQKLFLFIRQGGPAVRNMSAEQMWGMGPAVMNALGASQAGTALMSLFQQLIGHVVAGKRVAVAMEEAGMLTPGKWEVERGGKVRMDKDAVPDQAGFIDHPFTWLHDHLGEMRKKKGADGKPIDAVGIIQQIFQLSSRATSARLINDIDTNWPILKNEEARWKRMPDIAAISKEQNDKDLSVNFKNLIAAWDNFMTALGGPGIPIAINVLQSLKSALNKLQEEVIAHPTIAADVLYLVGVAAALTVLGGTITILNLAWAPLVAGLGLLVNITGLAAAGASITAIATGLAALVVPLAALVALFVAIKPGQAGEGEDAELKRFKADPGNYAPLPRNQSYTIPPHANGNGTGGVQQVHVVNGRDLARGTASYMGHQADLPNAGPSKFDGRMGRAFPSNTVAA